MVLCGIVTLWVLVPAFAAIFIFFSAVFGGI